MAADSGDMPSSISEILETSKDYTDRIERLSEHVGQRVSKVLFLIDNAVYAWEAAGKKPEQLRREVLLLKELYSSFSEWQKRLLLCRGKRPMIKANEEKVEILRNFAELCSKFERRFSAQVS